VDLDFHDCNSGKQVGKTSQTEDATHVTHYSWAEYYCTVCGKLQFIDDHAPTRVAKNQ
jgi:hypothetical protein